MIKSSEPGLQQGAPLFEEIKFSSQAKRWTVIILVGLVVIFLLQIAHVLPPFIWAIVTAFIFNTPINRLMSRFKLPRWTLAAGIFLIFFAVLITALALLIPALSKEAKTLSADAPNIEQNFNNYLATHSSVNILGIEIASETISSTVGSAIDRLPEFARELGPKALTQTARFLLEFLIYLVATFYLMLMGGRFIWRFIDTLPLKYRPEIRGLIQRINSVLSGYIRGQVLLVLIMSVSASIVLTILGVRYSLLLGVMVGVLELIPFVGPYLAITICSLVAFFQPTGSFGLGGLTLAVIVVVLLFILRQLEDYVVIPNLIGHIVELPGLLIIFSILAGEALLGPMGLLLAVPIVATIKIIVGFLYYKLVDADREKLFLAEGTTPEQFQQILLAQPEKTRLLVITDSDKEYLQDRQGLAILHSISQQRQIDLAFYCGEDEQAAQQVREAGFPIVTMSQEHFPGNGNS